VNTTRPTVATTTNHQQDIVDQHDVLRTPLNQETDRLTRHPGCRTDAGRNTAAGALGGNSSAPLRIPAARQPNSTPLPRPQSAPATTLTDGSGVSSMIRTSPSAHQAIYDMLYTALRRVLREGMQAGTGADEGTNSLQCRVAGVLYALLMAHPIDRHGRCCRRPGSVIGRRRQSCVVYVEVNHWLHQSDERLRARVAHQWGLVEWGAVGVIGTLWRVADESTAILMRTFYDLWRGGGLPIPHALAAAQRALRTMTNAELLASYPALFAERAGQVPRGLVSTRPDRRWLSLR
jgi:CHAT domain